jgi:uncharacterized YigZ family protein
VEHPGTEPNGADPPDSYLTIARTAETELKLKRSRFLALTFPLEIETDARARLEETVRRYHDARHVCFGYKLGVGADALTRKSDDGEPSGTAGEPLLAAIARLELTNVLVIVVRYFGGIKLGTGGLARAYGQAADLVLEQAGLRQVGQGREFRLRFAYTREKSIRKLLGSREGRLVDQQYGQDVSWRIWLPHSACRGFAEALTELTAGAIHLEEPSD